MSDLHNIPGPYISKADYDSDPDRYVILYKSVLFRYHGSLNRPQLMDLASYELLRECIKETIENLGVVYNVQEVEVVPDD